VFGGKVKSFDAARVSGMRGMRSVQVGDSGSRWSPNLVERQTALEQCRSSGTRRERQGVEREHRGDPQGGTGAGAAFVGNQTGGDVKAALAGAAKRIERSTPIRTEPRLHGPMNATVRYTPDKCELWVRRRTARRLCAGARGLGLTADKVDVHKSCAGGFGRRGTYPDYVRQAV